MFLSRLNSLRIGWFSQMQVRNATSGSVKLEDPIVVTDDGTTLVCYHPEKEFPYEYTRPMPERVATEERILRTTREEAVKRLAKQRPESEVITELARLTHTTKHRWYPRNWDRRKRVKRIDPDRPGL